MLNVSRIKRLNLRPDGNEDGHKTEKPVSQWQDVSNSMKSFCPLIEVTTGLLDSEIQIRREIFTGDSRQYSVTFGTFHFVKVKLMGERRWKTKGKCFSRWQVL